MEWCFPHTFAPIYTSKDNRNTTLKPVIWSKYESIYYKTKWCNAKLVQKIAHNYDQIIYWETNIQEQLQHGLVACYFDRHKYILFPYTYVWECSGSFGEEVS